MARQPAAAAAIAAMPPTARAARAPCVWPTHPMIGPPIGVLPRNATPHRAITRPRISGAAPSCRAALAVAMNRMLAAPTANSATTASGSVGAAATARISTPKTAEYRSSAVTDASERRADANPPMTAPAPMTALMIP